MSTRRRLAAAQTPPAVEALDPQTEEDQSRFLIANFGAVLILVGIFGFGFTVLTGVVEEKQSRVVEVVLSTVRARDLLMGKVLGIGVLGIVQLIVFVVAALVAASLTNQLSLPAITPAVDRHARDVVRPRLPAVRDRARLPRRAGVADGGGLERLDPGDDDRDDQLLRGHLRGHQTTPTGTVATIATFLPPSAPFVVPLRAAFDAIPPWQIGLSALITLIGIWVLFAIGARVYAGAVLQVGGRMKIRDAWRSGRGVTGPAYGSSGSNSPGVPPACQKTTRRPSSRPERTSATRPASAFAV